MSYSMNSNDARRRYESGYYDARIHKKAGKQNGLSDASSSDYIDGYKDGWDGKHNKCEEGKQ